MSIKKVLIANRGEISVRILRTLRKLDLQSVAVHSVADKKAMHVMFADESVCIGPSEARLSYNNIKSVIAAAELTGADAIHPGYGFLSENDSFADIVEEHGLTFLGPTGDHIRSFGSKVTAKQIMESAGVDVVPGNKELISDADEAYEKAKDMDLPILLKSPSCGGGRGQRIVWDLKEFKEKFVEAQEEAFAICGDRNLYIEIYFDNPKHIELQVLGDGKGKVISLGERDCSMQRKHQKVIEEAPANIPQKLRDDVYAKVCKVMGEHCYRSLGTVEFLYYKEKLYFIEVNTRIQVEHPVTESVTGLDLVEMQLIVGNQGEIPNQSDITIRGHAIESRITAEDPFTFIPSPGKVTQYLAPGGPNVRIDGALYPGWVIPPHYDSLATKIISSGKNRDEAIKTHKQALKELAISGIKTSTELHNWIIERKDFLEDKVSTQWLEKALKSKD